MSMLNDPEMKEVVDDFCKESLDLFSDLEEVLDSLEDDPTQTQYLEQYGQMIDRVMGAAKTIEADEVAMYCELGKIIGYKSSQIKDQALLEVVVAVLFDSVDLLTKMVKEIQSGNAEYTANLNTKAFGSRLHWLSDKFKDIDRASCDFDAEQAADDLDQSDIDDLLDDLGL